MEFYKQLLIKILEASSSASESEILKILKSGNDLNAREREKLEELVNSII